MPLTYDRIYLRELIRLTGFAPRTVQQEVEKLVSAGLLRERRDGNRRYLRANDGHVLFRAIREIVLKTDGLADVLPTVPSDPHVRRRATARHRRARTED